MVVAQTLSADAAARAFQRFGEVVGLDMPLCCFETRHHANCTIRVLFMSSQLRMFFRLSFLHHGIIVAISDSVGYWLALRILATSQAEL